MTNYLSPEAQKQAAIINAQLGDDMRDYYDRREQRRVIAEAQERCSSWQSSICDKIRAETPREIQDFITNLRDKQPAVVDYIRWLQTLKYGVWCPQCDRVKSVTGRPDADIAADVAVEIATGEDQRVIKKSVPEAERKPMGQTFSHAPVIPAIAGAASNTLTASEPHIPAIMAKPRLSPALAALAASGSSKLTTHAPPIPLTTSAAATQVPKSWSEPTTATATHATSNPFDTLDARVAAVRELRNDIATKLEKLNQYIQQLETWAAYKNSSAGNTMQCADADIDALVNEHMHGGGFASWQSYAGADGDEIYEDDITDGGF